MTIIEALAISYSDGSFNLMTPDTGIEKAREERGYADHKETDPAHLSDIVKIRFEVIEVVGRFRSTKHPLPTPCCAACGKPTEDA